MKNVTVFGFLAATLVVTLMLVGCADESETKTAKGDTANSQTATTGDHSGWWCVEHAIPEEECSMCSTKFATECKEKGDWCEEHNRAKSQCFKCDPSLAEKYVKLYEAKFGKTPPAATE